MHVQLCKGFSQLALYDGGVTLQLLLSLGSAGWQIFQLLLAAFARQVPCIDDEQPDTEHDQGCGVPHT